MILHGGKINLPAINKVELVEVSTNSGDHYFVPKTGDQCWDSPQLCTPLPVKNLQWHKQGNRYIFSTK
jgi:hypothetical protein